MVSIMGRDVWWSVPAGRGGRWPSCSCWRHAVQLVVDHDCSARQAGRCRPGYPDAIPRLIVMSTRT
ncbi:MAG: hypothetical protein C0631_10755 [Sedimenticola sp.]|nr:MAG: hypothetical protein C0631_10755 [Sedimenticola sp.]